MKLTAATKGRPEVAAVAAAARYVGNLREAAIYATDRASKEAQRGVQERIRAAGLGRLANAVGQTSMRKELGSLRGASAQVKAYRSRGNPYGVIFARGGDDSLGGGALESYSRGSTIRPLPGGQWLAIPTAAVPRIISIDGKRQRLTPELYMRSGLMTSIGKLEFRPLGPNKAIWVIKRVSVSAKNGRAKALGPRGTRTRIAQKEVIAFVGIRVTRRAQRFDKDKAVAYFAARVPDYMDEYLANRSRGGV